MVEEEPSVAQVAVEEPPVAQLAVEEPPAAQVAVLQPTLDLQPPSAAAFAAYAAAVAEGLFPDDLEDEVEDEDEDEPEPVPPHLQQPWGQQLREHQPWEQQSQDQQSLDHHPVDPQPWEQHAPEHQPWEPQVAAPQEWQQPVHEQLSAPGPHLVPVPYSDLDDTTMAGDQPASPMPPLVGYGRIVTVYSPKGGTGTTFFATNLAVALTDGGRRRVCLVDLDLQFGDVAIATSVTPSRGIVDAVDLDLLHDPTALSRITTPVMDGLDGLLAPVDPAAGEAVSPQLVADLLATLRGRYDYVVVDTSTHLSEITLEALETADHQVLLTTPDLPAIKNMRLFLDTLDLLGTDPARRSVVLNRLDQRVGLQAGRATEALRHPLAAVVPADPEVGASIDAGRPLLVVRRADTMNAVLRAFAEHHLGATPDLAARPKRRLRLGRKNAS